MDPLDPVAGAPAPSLSSDRKGPLCVIIQNPVNNAKRDANLLYQIRNKMLWAFAKKAKMRCGVGVTITPSWRTREYHTHMQMIYTMCQDIYRNMQRIYMYVRDCVRALAAFQFYPFYWLGISSSCLKFIRKYFDKVRGRSFWSFGP